MCQTPVRCRAWRGAVAFLEGVLEDQEYGGQVCISTLPACCRHPYRGTLVARLGGTCVQAVAHPDSRLAVHGGLASRPD